MRSEFDYYFRREVCVFFRSSSFFLSVLCCVALARLSSIGKPFNLFGVVFVSVREKRIFFRDKLSLINFHFRKSPLTKCLDYFIYSVECTAAHARARAPSRKINYSV